MAYYDALKTQWASLTGTTADKLAALNAMTAAGPSQDVPASEVLAYLAMNAKLANLQAYASSPPSGAVAGAVVAAKELLAILSFPSFGGFQTSKAGTLTAVNGFLTALESDSATGITSADVAALLALTTTTIPWWQANGYPGAFNVNDLAAAGGLV